jgi:outer membrane immunogenic protein
MELDFGSFRLRNAVGGANVPYPPFPGGPANYSMRAAIESDWLLTARARVGWTPASNFLIYATGGLAATRVQVRNSFSDTAPEEGVGGASNDQTKIGWTVGGGAEWALSSHWSFKAEYLHVDFGTTKASGSIFCGPSIPCNGVLTPNPFVSSADLSADVMRLGLNYRY